MIAEKPAKTGSDIPATGPGDKRVCIVVNSKSGSAEAERMERLREAISRHGDLDWELAPTRQPEELSGIAARAVSEGVGTVVACGGDGTISAVAAEVAGSDTRMGVLPQGTFNFFARGLGIPDDMEEGIANIARGYTQPVDVGEINGQVFLNNASLGLYPAILRQRESIYQKWGRSRMAAYWSVFKTMARFRRPLSITVESNGHRKSYKTPLAFVANSAYQLELMGFEAADDIKDGKLVLLLSTNGSRVDLLKRTFRLGTGLATQGRDYIVLTSDRFVIDTERKSRLVARDGERDIMPGPYDIRLLRGALQVIVPETPT